MSHLKLMEMAGSFLLGHGNNFPTLKILLDTLKTNKYTLKYKENDVTMFIKLAFPMQIMEASDFESKYQTDKYQTVLQVKLFYFLNLTLNRLDKKIR